MYKIYNIVLHTDIGDRIGKLKVFISEGKLKGQLYILGKVQEFEGIIDDSGKCELYGTLVSLKNKINYIATGYLHSSELLMTLKYKARSYLLKGQPCEA